MTERCRPAGTLAWRQYEVTLDSGRVAIVGLSLGDPHDRTVAKIGRQHAAANLGFLVVLDDPESVEEVVLWFQQATALTLVSQNGDVMIGDEMLALLPRYFTVFFDEIKDMAPGLADIRLSPTARKSRKDLH